MSFQSLTQILASFWETFEFILLYKITIFGKSNLMNTEEKRKTLSKWILETDENVLNEVEAIYKITNQNMEISDKHKTILDQRLKDHQDSPTSGRNWTEIKAELSSKYGF